MPYFLVDQMCKYTNYHAECQANTSSFAEQRSQLAISSRLILILQYASEVTGDPFLELAGERLGGTHELSAGHDEGRLAVDLCRTAVVVDMTVGLLIGDPHASGYRGVADRLPELPGLTGEDGCLGPLRGVAPGLSGVTIPWALRLSPLRLLPGVEQLVGISLVVEGLAEVVDHRLPYDVLSISLEVLPDVVGLPSEAVSEV